MADIRINALATTAASTASDDYIAIDGSANGTRKLDAYNPTFGGNLTVSGTGTSSFAGPVTGTSSTNGYQWTLTGSGIGGPSIALDATNATVANRYSGLTFYSGGTFQWGLQLRAGDGKFHIYDGVRGADALTVDVGPSSGVAGTTTVGGNLTVSGGTITGGTSGMSLASGGTNQNITLTPSGTGKILLKLGDVDSQVNVEKRSTADIAFLAGNAAGSAARTLYFQGASVQFGIGGVGEVGRFAPTTGNLLIGTTVDSSALLQVGTNTTTVAGGMKFGTDTALFRLAAGHLSVDSTGNNPSLKLSISGTAYGWMEYYSPDNAVYLNSGTGKSLVLRTNGGTTALTLDSSQNATFAGKITANGAGSTFKGTATNDSAAAGYVGEYVSSRGTSVALTSNTNTNVTSISLTAGDWDVEGSILISPSGTLTLVVAGVSSTSATYETTEDGTTYLQTTFGAGQAQQLSTGTRRYSLSATTTIYLIGKGAFASGTTAANGVLRARRVR